MEEQTMATNTINVKACDNQLLIYATQWGYSYPIVNLNSGNSHPVDVTINVEAGIYQQGYYGNNVNGEPLPTPFTVYLPAGTYALNCVGIDWGGPFQIAFTVNGTSYGSGPLHTPTPDVGVWWSTGSAPIQLVVS
jgi:hypothetical protein